MTAEFQVRSQQAIRKFAGSNYGSTAFENEKRSYPRAMMDFLAATGTDPTKISTSSIGGDNVAQYRNLVIWLNNKPLAPFQFFLPKSALIETRNSVTFISYEKTWLALTPINLHLSGINLTANKKIQSRYPDDQILTAVGTGRAVSGFALEVGEQETYGSWSQFQQSIVKKSRLTLSEINHGVVGYQGVFAQVKLQYQGNKLPKVWRNDHYHDWRDHFALYQSADGHKTPIYSGWKSGKLRIEAGGYQFQSQSE